MAKKLYEEQNIYDIACAIREKCGDEKAKFKTCDMADAIRDLEIGGGGGTTEGGIPTPIVLGNGIGAIRMFSCAIWNKFIEDYGDQLEINTWTLEEMFRDNTGIVDASNLTINVYLKEGVNTTVSTYNMFNSCFNLQELPTIKGDWIPTTFGSMFFDCRRLKTIPARFFRNVDYSKFSSTYRSFDLMLYHCYSLRSFPFSIYGKDNPNKTDGFYWLSAENFYNLYSMDKFSNLPIPYINAMSNRTLNIYGHRVNEVTFEMDEDDDENPIPLARDWSKIRINLRRAGFFILDEQITNLLTYNDDFTAEDEVIDAATYEALKDTDNWYTRDLNFSRYNHDSAVNTINSLPDTTSSTTGGNTLEFRNGAGAATDGGSVSDLTESEIAVAAAKGWTVTFANSDY